MTTGTLQQARRFDGDTIVADALTLHPKVRWVFAAYHLGGCSSCGTADVETLREVADGYGISLEELLGNLNALLD